MPGLLDPLRTIRPGMTVAAPYADQFSGLLSDLEANGYPVNGAESGGYNPRMIAGTNIPSQHASGRAIDVNWADNPRNRNVQPTIPPFLADSLARKHGLEWGGLWKNADPMHFQVANGQAPPSAVAGAQPQPMAPSMALGGTNVPPPQASAPTPSTGSKPMPGLLDGYDFGKAFSNPLFQFGAGMAGAGGKGMGIGGGFAAGAEAVKGGQEQGINQRAKAAGEQAKRTLLDPSNPAGLDGATRAIVSSMSPEQAVAYASSLAGSKTAVGQALGIARGNIGIQHENLDYLKQKFGRQAAVSAATNQPPPPQPGQIVQGHRFLGGDPSNPASWQPLGGQ